MSKQASKPFRVAIQWLYYGHENAQETNSIARELMQKVNKSPNKQWLNISHVHQVREIVSVAELYARAQPGDDEEDEITRRRATAVIKRGKKWLAENTTEEDPAHESKSLLSRGPRRHGGKSPDRDPRARKP